MLNKVQHQNNHITNTRCKTITYFPNIDNLMINSKFVTHLSIHNINCLRNCIFGYNCKNPVNAIQERERERERDERERERGEREREREYVCVTTHLHEKSFLHMRTQCS